jgi:hypothetical protein
MSMIFIIIAVVFGILAVALAVVLVIAGREIDSIVLRPPQKLPRPY